MGLLSFGIVLIVLGVILAATNLFGFSALGGTLVWLGWIAIGIGIVLAVLHFLTGARRRDVIIDRRPPTY